AQPTTHGPGESAAAEQAHQLGGHDHGVGRNSVAEFAGIRVLPPAQTRIPANSVTLASCPFSCHSALQTQRSTSLIRGVDKGRVTEAIPARIPRMEPSHDSPTTPRAEAPVLAPVELVLQTGRLKGSSRPLMLPLTLVGRAGGCDLRLNVAGVAAQHCALVLAPTGLVLRDLQNPSTTLVNGTAVRTCVLKHDDVLTIGPFQFQVRIKAPSTLEQLASLQSRYGKEKEALRIQAAAVAAQQAALTDEEAKL